MNNVLNITDRIKDIKRKQQMKVLRNKIETVQRTIECASCHFKCAMCGRHLAGTGPSCASTSCSGLNLCENCRAEFQDFSEMSKGKKGCDTFWHNKEWLRLWSAWLDYRRAISEFRNTTEFKQLNSEPDD